MRTSVVKGGFIVFGLAAILALAVACAEEKEEPAATPRPAPTATAPPTIARVASPTPAPAETPRALTPTVTVGGEAVFGGIAKGIPQAGITALDGQVISARTTRYPAINTQETAMGRDLSWEIKPMLAEKWEISGDQLTWTVTIRNGVKFHTGEPMTAADVVGSWLRAEKAQIASAVRKEFLDSIEAVDDLTFEIKLTEPTGLVLPALSFGSAGTSGWVTPERIWSLPAAETTNDLIGTGPFKLVRWDPGDRVVFERYEDYTPRTGAPSWTAGGHTAYLDGFELLEVPDAATRVAALSTGEVDWVDEYPSDFADQIRNSPDAVFHTGSPGRLVAFIFNNSRPPFDNVIARRAVMIGLDNDEILGAMGGGPKGGFWDTCPGIYGCGFAETRWNTDAGSEGMFNEFDVPRARQMLEEAGVLGAKIVLLSPEDLAGFVNLTRPMEQNLKDMGFVVDFASMDWSTNVKTIRDKEGDWDISITGTKMGGDFHPLFLTWVKPMGSNNWYEDRSGRMAEYFTKVVRETTFDAQKAVVEDIQRLHYEDVPYLNLGVQTWATGVSKRFKNYFVTTLPYFADTWLEE